MNFKIIVGVTINEKNNNFGSTSIVYGQSEWVIQNQVFIALIVFCLHVLIQIETRSKRKTLQISRYLMAALWKPAHIWLRKIEGKAIS